MFNKLAFLNDRQDCFSVSKYVATVSFFFLLSLLVAGIRFSFNVP